MNVNVLALAIGAARDMAGAIDAIKAQTLIIINNKLRATHLLIVRKIILLYVHIYRTTCTSHTIAIKRLARLLSFI